MPCQDWSTPNPTAATKSHVQADISDSAPLPISTSSALLSRIRLWYRFSSLRLLLTESRNLGHRIGWCFRIRRVKLHRGDSATGLWMKEAAFLGSGPYTRDHTRYMQDIKREIPFLSVFDRLLVAKAWKAGWESCARVGMSLSESQYRSLLPLVVSENVISHAINSPKSQMRELIPAAIAGVTRKDECTRQKL